MFRRDEFALVWAVATGSRPALVLTRNAIARPETALSYRPRRLDAVLRRKRYGDLTRKLGQGA